MTDWRFQHRFKSYFTCKAVLVDAREGVLGLLVVLVFAVYRVNGKSDQIIQTDD